VASSNGIAVRAQAVVKDFPSGNAQTRVLHGVDLEVEAGRLTLLIGPSGCGKTTLLSIVTGILSPTGGDVDVMGERIISLRGKRAAPFRRERLGFTFQQYNLLPALSAAENAAIPLVAASVALDEAAARAGDARADRDGRTRAQAAEPAFGRADAAGGDRARARARARRDRL
jgi:putative ABC transport system ATP-binding protein